MLLYNNALYKYCILVLIIYKVVEALHGSHVFCLSSHVIRNLNWKYTLLKFHILQIFLSSYLFSGGQLYFTDYSNVQNIFLDICNFEITHSIWILC